MNKVIGFSILFAVVGLLFIGLSIPLILGKVPPNSLYGCRTRRTLSDPKIWYEANRASGRDFFICGVLVFTASIVILLFGQGMNPEYAVAALLSVLLLSVTGAAWHCFRIGRRR